MKTCLRVSILPIVSAVPIPYAVGQSKQPQQGTIVNVQKQDVATPLVRTGADPVRTPLQSHYYLYNVSVRLNCDVYVGRYESDLNDLPPALSANNSVPVRLMKHTMHLDFPGDSVKMQIVHQSVRKQRVIRRRLRSENTLGPVMLIGGQAWMIFVSLVSTLVPNLAPDWVRRPSLPRAYGPGESCGLTRALVS
jgi:hypothetical protein